MIIDAFPFFQEIELLKVRLDYLGETVDKFLISESEIDFAGNNKQVILNKRCIDTLPYKNKLIVVQNKHSQILKKIIYPLAKRLKWRKPLWGIQLKQRNSLVKIIKKFDSKDILLFGDLDEFPNADQIENLKSLLTENPEKVYTFNQRSLVYNIYNKDENPIWRGTVACSIKKAVKTTPNSLRKKRHSSKMVANGWHFSYFGSNSQIQNKIRSVALVEKHFDLLNPSINDVKSKIASKNNPFQSKANEGIKLSKEDYPENLISAFDKFMPKSIEECKLLKS